MRATTKYEMELEIECRRHQAATAQALISRALAIIEQVERGEKKPAVLQTAQGHLLAAQKLLGEDHDR